MLTVGELLKSLANENHFFRKLYLEAMLEGGSELILGPQLAKHCSFSYGSADRLSCVCDDYIWANEVRMRKRAILRRVKEMTGFDFSDLLIGVQFK